MIVHKKGTFCVLDHQRPRRTVVPNPAHDAAHPHHDLRGSADGGGGRHHVGAGNKLNWPLSGASLGACRAYFQLADGAEAREFKLRFVEDPLTEGSNFGEETTGIISTTDFTDYTDKAGAWYTLDGRKLDKKPTRKGLYIYGGRKVVIP